MDRTSTRRQIFQVQQTMSFRIGDPDVDRSHQILSEGIATPFSVTANTTAEVQASATARREARVKKKACSVGLQPSVCNTFATQDLRLSDDHCKRVVAFSNRRGPRGKS